ncbi:MAG: hypothetical protein D4R84_10935 [Rhodocyclaceae bacterium]|nr:MAG: hypothetical protein D4R84_10935 [Rhodocyclaceae bacterium]
MNRGAKTSVTGTSAGHAASKETDQLNGLTVPVRIRGPSENRSYQIKFGNMVSDAAAARVEEKREEIMAKVGDKVKDKLKGLSGK